MAGKRLGILRARPGLVDAGAALLLSAFAVATLPPHVNPAAAAACGLAATSSVGWRNRAPGIAVVIAGAGLAGYAWRTSSSSAFAEPLALILVMYTAGARGVSRRQVGQLVALVGYGIAVCVLVDAAAGPVSISAWPFMLCRSRSRPPWRGSWSRASGRWPGAWRPRPNGSGPGNRPAWRSSGSGSATGWPEICTTSSLTVSA